MLLQEASSTQRQRVQERMAVRLVRFFMGVAAFIRVQRIQRGSVMRP